MNTEQMIAVMQAWLRGERVERRSREEPAQWHLVPHDFGHADPGWDATTYDYRIVPREQREWWITPDGHAFGDEDQANTYFYFHCQGFNEPVMHVRQVMSDDTRRAQAKRDNDRIDEIRDAVLARAADAAIAEDSWLTPIKAWLSMRTEPFSIASLLCCALSIPLHEHDAHSQRRASLIVRSLGYTQRMFTGHRMWVKADG